MIHMMYYIAALSWQIKTQLLGRLRPTAKCVYAIIGRPQLRYHTTTLRLEYGDIWVECTIYYINRHDLYCDMVYTYIALCWKCYGKVSSKSRPVQQLTSDAMGKTDHSSIHGMHQISHDINKQFVTIEWYSDGSCHVRQEYRYEERHLTRNHGWTFNNSIIYLYKRNRVVAQF